MSGRGELGTAHPTYLTKPPIVVSAFRFCVTVALVSKKSAHIERLIESCQGRELEAHYLGYFECFNRGLFYESHDVLEELWLQDRQGPDGNFFKGLIQFAGAFVHLQKHTTERPRLRPSAALFKLARTNLQGYPSGHRQLNLEGILLVIEEWLAALESDNYETNPLHTRKPPLLKLLPAP